MNAPTLARRLAVGLGVFALLAGAAVGDTRRDRSNLDIGFVSSGLGSGPGPGAYYVTLSIYSHKRYAAYADDGGHEEWWCTNPDVAHNACGPKPPNDLFPIGCDDSSSAAGDAEGWYYDFALIDGVNLASDDVDHYSGVAPTSTWQYTIEGSLNNCNGGTKWEWPSEGYMDRYGLSNSLRWTQRNRLILRLRYTVAWNGSKISSRVRAKWLESDSGVFDDHSEWAYFTAGDMVTKCLQGGTSGITRSILPANLNYYWHLCSEDGTCVQGFDNVGPGGLHYNIATYYNVSCYWSRAPVCGDAQCTGNETYQSCPGDCPASWVCGDGSCDCEWGESGFLCPEDCGPTIQCGSQF